MKKEDYTRLQILEEKFTFQENMLDQLSDVLIRQQRQIDKLKEELNRINSVISSMPQEEKDPLPPHY